MKRYFYNILIGVDQLVNAILGGDPDETISSRIGKRAREGYKISIFLSKFLDIFDKNHAEDAIEEDEGKNAMF
jgi:hypothetical protein